MGQDESKQTTSFSYDNDGRPSQTTVHNSSNATKMMMVATGVTSTGTFAAGYGLGKLSSGSSNQYSGGGSNSDNIFKKN
jgi:hypothetical protein